MFKPLIVTFGLMLGVQAWAAEPANEPILAVQPAKISNPKKVELGKQLFFDPRLSKSGFISCNSCHNLSQGGSDNLPTSIGHNWHQGPINSPTVLNSSMNVVQFWDGRAATLKEQAGGPIANPGEVGFTHDLAADVVRSIAQYRDSFKQIYGTENVSIDEITDALAAFEETLVTPNAPFDRWLKGEKHAISPAALKGYELFKSTGCIACHNGEGVGGSSLQTMGLVAPYVTRNPAEGVAALTGKDADRMRFKVPTLRNVELSYPYFHDGAYWNLEEAVEVMARLQLGRKLRPEEISQMVVFLKTLTGDQPDFKLPILPPSSVQTPRPVPFDQ